MDFPSSKRLAKFQTGIFNELAEYKKVLETDGTKIIDLSIGNPDQAPPDFIIEAMAQHVSDPKQYGYTLSGTEDFHQAVCTYYRRNFGVNLDARHDVLTLMGSQDGLVHLPMAFADPGDLMLVPDPGYTAYEAGVNMSGADTYPLPLKKENHFLPDLSMIPEEIAYKAKLMMLNFPGNPVPALAGPDFFKEVVHFAKKYSILVVHDFAYSELVYDGQRATSFLEVDGAKEVGVEVNSLSKSFNMAGCRIGYIVGKPQVLQTVGKLKSNLDYGVFLPIQKAGALALRDTSSFLADNVYAYEKRRNILVQGLARCGWPVDNPPATMFVWAQIPEGWTSRSFAFQLMEKARVAVTPGDVFGQYGEGFVRIAFVQPEQQIQEAVERIHQSGILKS